jgi:hypothetical protein
MPETIVRIGTGSGWDKADVQIGAGASMLRTYRYYLNLKAQTILITFFVGLKHVGAGALPK